MMTRRLEAQCIQPHGPASAFPGCGLGPAKQKSVLCQAASGVATVSAKVDDWGIGSPSSRIPSRWNATAWRISAKPALTGRAYQT